MTVLYVRLCMNVHMLKGNLFEFSSNDFQTSLHLERVTFQTNLAWWVEYWQRQSALFRFLSFQTFFCWNYSFQIFVFSLASMLYWVWYTGMWWWYHLNYWEHWFKPPIDNVSSHSTFITNWISEWYWLTMKITKSSMNSFVSTVRGSAG